MTFLKFFYQKCVLEFPLLDAEKVEAVKEKMGQLLVMWPKFMNLTHKTNPQATKSDKSGRMVDILELMLNTEKEKKTSSRIKILLVESLEIRIASLSGSPAPKSNRRLNSEDERIVKTILPMLSYKREAHYMYEVMFDEMSKKPGLKNFSNRRFLFFISPGLMWNC